MTSKNTGTGAWLIRSRVDSWSGDSRPKFEDWEKKGLDCVSRGKGGLRVRKGGERRREMRCLGACLQRDLLGNGQRRLPEMSGKES